MSTLGGNDSSPGASGGVRRRKPAVGPIEPAAISALVRAGVEYREALKGAETAYAKAVSVFQARLRGPDWPHHVVADISFGEHRVVCACGWGIDLTPDDILALVFADHRRWSGKAEA